MTDEDLDELYTQACRAMTNAVSIIAAAINPPSGVFHWGRETYIRRPYATATDA